LAKHYSFSRMSLFEHCPRRYYHRYIEGIPEPPSSDAEFGKLVHATIAESIKAKKENRGSKPEDIASATALGYPLLSDKEIKEAVSLSKRFLNGYRPDENVLVEHKLTANLGKGRSLIGYADLIEFEEDHIVITDFKLGHSPHNVLETKQLPLYAWMASQQFGINSIVVRLIWLRNRRQFLSEESTDERLQQDALGWATNTIRLIEAAEQLPGWAGFREQPGSYCAHCTYGAQCLTLSVPDDPASLGSLILRLENFVAELKDKLKTHVEANGPLVVNDEVFDFHARISREWDVLGLVALLDKLKLDPYNYLSADTRKLKKLLEGKYADMFRSVSKEKETRYFMHKKRTENEAAKNRAIS
jgi:putative RecB family exonuclease